MNMWKGVTLLAIFNQDYYKKEDNESSLFI